MNRSAPDFSYSFEFLLEIWENHAEMTKISIGWTSKQRGDGDSTIETNQVQRHT